MVRMTASSKQENVKHLEAHKRWKQRNPEYQRQYYSRNAAKKRAYAKAYRDKNRDKVRLQDIARHRRVRQEVLDAYGRVCVCCGENREPFLTLDHFTQDQGTRATWKGVSLYMNRGHREYARLKRLGWPPIVRILCMNCNFARRRGNVCPHDSERQRIQSNVG
jgi:hypothetical protein